MAEIGLDGASVVAVVGELEPAGMPQHVGMHEEREFRSHARPGHHALISGCGKRCATFRDEDRRVTEPKSPDHRNASMVEGATLNPLADFRADARESGGLRVQRRIAPR